MESNREFAIFVASVCAFALMVGMIVYDHDVDKECSRRCAPFAVYDADVGGKCVCLMAITTETR